MKKIFYLTFLVTLFIFVNDCSGYKPIFGTTSLQFEISNYDIEGNKVLGDKLYSKLYSLSKSKKVESNSKSIDLLINILETKSATSKDSSGKILEYKIDLNTKIEITDSITSKKLLDQNFNSSLIYKIQDQYSDTIKLENQTIENLLNKTLQEIIINLTKNISS